MGRFALLLGAALAWCLTQTAFSKPLAIERNLTIEGSEKTLSLEEAMSRLTKAGINLGYQSFIIFYPATGQGLVVMTNSEHGEILCKALIRRAATLYGWPRVADLIE